MSGNCLLAKKNLKRIIVENLYEEINTNWIIEDGKKMLFYDKYKYDLVIIYYII